MEAINPTMPLYLLENGDAKKEGKEASPWGEL